MKFAKVLAATTLTLAAANAMAFTPPYHINGTAILGTATFKSAGGCKVAPKKFANAQFGSIRDSLNANVGQGVISADGNAILAVANSSYPQIYVKLFQDTNVPQKTDVKLLYSFIDNNVRDYIAAQSGCQPMGIWTTPNSYVTQKVSGSGGSGSIIDIAIKQSFVGHQAPALGTTCEQDAGVTKCNLKKFTGGMTFKGQYVVP